MKAASMNDHNEEFLYKSLFNSYSENMSVSRTVSLDDVKLENPSI